MLAPGHVMLKEKLPKVIRVNIQLVVAAQYPDLLARVIIRNAKPAAFVIYKAVKGNLAKRAKILSDFGSVLQRLQSGRTFLAVDVQGNAIYGPVVDAVLLIAPFPCLAVHVGNVQEYPPREEIFFHKAHQPFYLTLV